MPFSLLDIGFKAILVEIIMWNLTNGENIFDTGFRLFDSSIGMVLTCEFGHDIIILKMAIFDKVNNIEIKPALACSLRLGIM